MGAPISADHAPPAQRTDILVVFAHPDDEIAWFGGLLPLHVAAGRRVAAVCMTDGGAGGPALAAQRADELRASLRTCGVETLHWGGFADCGWIDGGGFESLDWTWQRWGGRTLARDRMIALFDHLRPETVYTHHPEHGDYGHPNHMATGWACLDAFDACRADRCLVGGDRACLQRCYVSSTVTAPAARRVDWHRPLPRFGGSTAAEVAAAALRCHRSQDCRTAGVRAKLAYERWRGDDDDPGPWLPTDAPPAVDVGRGALPSVR